MLTSDPVITARDYNGALAAPVRWTHAAIARWRVFWNAMSRDWAGPLVLGLVGVLALLPLDGPTHRLMEWLSKDVLGGDFRRELGALQQYGQFTFSVVIGLVIFSLDYARRRRLLDWLLAGLLTWAVCFAMKVFFGRARPRDSVTDDPGLWLGPLGLWPVRERGTDTYTLRGSWSAGSDFWSMPSSHTAMAVVASVFLALMYPRLRWLAIILALLVAFARVLLDAHWLTDVIAGAAVGAAIALPAIRGGWGQRLVWGKPATAL